MGSPVPPDATPAADPALQATPVSLATSTAAPSAPAGLATSTLAAISADAPRARPLLEGINVRGGPGIDYEAVSYTHLDVYKRQIHDSPERKTIC